MTEQEFAEYLSLSHELTGVEFKGPGPRSHKHLFAKVVRAVLGMANRRDGGIVIVGVDDSRGVLKPVGLSDGDLTTWKKYDDVASALAAYADPGVRFELEIQEHEKRNYVVLHVQEFDDIPVLCKKDYPPVLRDGACYVRSRRKPETTEIPSQADMRDLLELATEKRLRRFITQAHTVGLALSGVTPPTDQDLFDKQRIDSPRSPFY